jgi:hypothetical protein
LWRQAQSGTHYSEDDAHTTLKLHLMTLKRWQTAARAPVDAAT